MWPVASITSDGPTWVMVPTQVEQSKRTPPVGIEVVKKVAIARDAASGGGRSGGAGLLGYLFYLYFLPLPFAGIRSLVVRWMLAAAGRAQRRANHPGAE
jgi:hypothetical protein